MVDIRTLQVGQMVYVVDDPILKEPELLPEIEPVKGRVGKIRGFGVATILVEFENYSGGHSGNIYDDINNIPKNRGWLNRFCIELLDWRKLYFGHVSKEEVKEYIPEPLWQELRLSLKGVSLYEKYKKLEKWLENHPDSRRAQVQVTNYVTALSRGGLINPEDYR